MPEISIRNHYIKAVTAMRTIRNREQVERPAFGIRLKSGEDAFFITVIEGETRLFNGLSAQDLVKGLQVDVYYTERPARTPGKLFYTATRIFRSRPRQQAQAA